MSHFFGECSLEERMSCSINFRIAKSMHRYKTYVHANIPKPHHCDDNWITVRSRSRGDLNRIVSPPPSLASILTSSVPISAADGGKIPEISFRLARHYQLSFVCPCAMPRLVSFFTIESEWCLFATPLVGQDARIHQQLALRVEQ